MKLDSLRCFSSICKSINALQSNRYVILMINNACLKGSFELIASREYKGHVFERLRAKSVCH